VIVILLHNYYTHPLAHARCDGSVPDLLRAPVRVTYLTERHILNSDQLNERVIETNQHKQIPHLRGST
jgi:hypothetical protein